MDGQACMRGVGYAFRQLQATEPGKYIPKNIQQYDEQFLTAVLALFGQTLQKNLTSVAIQGSPERSLFRTVMQTQAGARFILEEIAAQEVAKRQTIASNLSILAQKNLPVIPYVDNTLKEYAGRYWQLSPYLNGEPLARATYWQEEWRGQAVADFLADLYREASALQTSEPVFSLRMYIEELQETITKARPELLTQLQPILAFLQKRLFSVYERIPLGFCHGDPHPLNMLWGEQKILAVIDWEFSGIKPVLYDAALIIGCVGVESPTAGEGGFIRAFRLRLKERQVFSEEILNLLPIFVLALRFAWLSEWLRRNDEEMLHFECAYMLQLMQQI